MNLYHIHDGAAQSGPFTFGQLRAMWLAGKLRADMSYWLDGMAGWESVTRIVPMLDGVPEPPPPQDPRANARHVPVAKPVASDKSRGTYIILGVLLGLLGIHNFYANRIGTGAWQLAATLLLGWTGIGLVAVAAWVLVELFTVFLDGNGAIMC